MTGQPADQREVEQAEVAVDGVDERRSHPVDQSLGRHLDEPLDHGLDGDLALLDLGLGFGPRRRRRQDGRSGHGSRRAAGRPACVGRRRSSRSSTRDRACSSSARSASRRWRSRDSGRWALEGSNRMMLRLSSPASRRTSRSLRRSRIRATRDSRASGRISREVRRTWRHAAHVGQPLQRAGAGGLRRGHRHLGQVDLVGHEAERQRGEQVDQPGGGAGTNLAPGPAPSGWRPRRGRPSRSPGRPRRRTGAGRPRAARRARAATRRRSGRSGRGSGSARRSRASPRRGGRAGPPSGSPAASPATRERTRPARRSTRRAWCAQGREGLAIRVARAGGDGPGRLVEARLDGDQGIGRRPWHAVDDARPGAIVGREGRRRGILRGPGDASGAGRAHSRQDLPRRSRSSRASSSRRTARCGGMCSRKAVISPISSNAAATAREQGSRRSRGASRGHPLVGGVGQLVAATAEVLEPVDGTRAGRPGGSARGHDRRRTSGRARRRAPGAARGGTGGPTGHPGRRPASARPARGGPGAPAAPPASTRTARRASRPARRDGGRRACPARRAAARARRRARRSWPGGARHRAGRSPRRAIRRRRRAPRSPWPGAAARTRGRSARSARRPAPRPATAWPAR